MIYWDSLGIIWYDWVTCTFPSPMNQGTPPATAPADAKPGPLTTAPELQHQVSYK
jgi:hypothetical protein